MVYPNLILGDRPGFPVPGLPKSVDDTLQSSKYLMKVNKAIISSNIFQKI